MNVNVIAISHAIKSRQCLVAYVKDPNKVLLAHINVLLIESVEREMCTYQELIQNHKCHSFMLIFCYEC